MKHLAVLALTLCVGLVLSMSLVPEAQAKRMGDGLSFGSKPSQNQSAKRSGSETSKPDQAKQQNESRKQELSKKGGLMGMLGGLMLGGLLGALLFGGAFENINFMDILLFAGIAFLLYKLFARRRQAQHVAANGAPLEAAYSTNSPNQLRQSAQDWGGASEHTTPKPATENILSTGKIPKGFDSKAFLKGAENVYYLLQEAWDKKELGDLRQFCTDSVFAQIQDQIRSRVGENRTEIIFLNSELVNVVIDENSSEATVVFNARLREFDSESALEPAVIQVQEAWYFVRPNNRQENVWLLDAIQQIEE